MKTFVSTILVLLSLAPLSGCSGNGKSETPAGSDQAVSAGVAGSAELCAAHDAPVDLCFRCDPALRDSGRLWCQEHGLYEDECYLCDPSRRSPTATSAHGGLHCAEHDVAESACGICHPELTSDLEPGGEMLVRLPSIRSAELADVTFGNAQVGAATGGVSGYVEIDYDRNRLARITPRVAGVITRVLVDVGEDVAEDAPLLEIASTQLATAKQDFLDARLELELRTQELERSRRLREQEIGSERSLQEAAAAMKRAATRAEATEQNLHNLGLDQDAIAGVAESADTSGQLVIRAPFAGQIIDRDAVLGESVTPESHLLSVADLSHMWLDLSLPQSALVVVETGLPVVAKFDALPGQEITGRIVWIATALDQRTRLLPARAEVANPGGKLKAGLYGRAEVGPARGTAALTLPRQAICDLDQRSFVLVRRAEDLYALRRVALGPRQGEAVAILAGLDPDETVITGGGFSVFSELLKSRFGAGCAEE